MLKNIGIKQSIEIIYSIHMKYSTSLMDLRGNESHRILKTMEQFQ